jgi:cell division topological specificity factor
MLWLRRWLIDWLANDAERAELGLDGAADPSNADNARKAACSRLKLVLTHDRSHLSPEQLQSLRDDLVSVISKYVEIDQDTLDLRLERAPEGAAIALVANIPVVATKTMVIKPTNAPPPEASASTDHDIISATAVVSPPIAPAATVG